MKFFKLFFTVLILLGLTGIAAGAAVAVMMWNEFSIDLPDHTKLKTYEPPITTRVYAWDGALMGEFAKEKRVFVPIAAIPEKVKLAFLSAEDRNFYQHKGIDFIGVMRAILVNLEHAGTSRRMVGASTITQQVAKNFLLTNEVSFERKIKEAILAYRLERAFSKDHLLELYMNQIYLGGGAYGVAAAAQHYFGKTLDELNVAEMAYLAALPKAPNNYNPVRHKDAAIARRNWVIARMLEDGHITREEAQEAEETPLTVISSVQAKYVEAPYFLEDVRRQVGGQFGDQSLYTGGLVVRSTLDPRMQDMATRALHKGLIEYDRRRSYYRGSVTAVQSLENWQGELNLVERPEGMLPQWQLAVVLKSGEGVSLGLPDGTKKMLASSDVLWGDTVLKPGAVVMVEITEEKAVNAEGAVDTDKKREVVRLRQIPKIQGALVALDPHTGRVLAMEGGWDYNMSEFNRATQAQRQTGSAFKPIIYAAALEKGLSPATLVNDAPIEFYAGPGQGMWRPKNYHDDFLGAIPLRVALEKSRNMPTIRLAQHVGMKTVAEYTKLFGVNDHLEPHLANSLGSAETTLLRLTSGYAVFVNGGRKITPSLIDRIQDRWGKTIYRHETHQCKSCNDRLAWNPTTPVPELTEDSQQIISPGVAYQMVELLEGVVQRGTATSLKKLNTPIAGKTGTTNESRDTWFVGFSPDLVVGVFVGFDEPRTLGEKETGATVAAPIFGYFMEEALKDQPPAPFRIPPDVRLVSVNAKTELRTTPDDPYMIWEPFVGDTDPENTRHILMGGTALAAPDGGSDLPAGDAPLDPNAAYMPSATSPDPVVVPDPVADPADAPYAPATSPPQNEGGEVAPPQPITSGTGGLY